MRLMLCGGTGFIGNALAQALLERGDEVWIVTRHLPATPVAGLLYVTWEEWSQQPWQWNGIDAIVNLVGESVGKKWTEERKRQILISRTLTALRIEDIVRRMDQPPKVLVNASGISLYGHSYSPLLKRKRMAPVTKLARKRSLFSVLKPSSRDEEKSFEVETLEKEKFETSVSSSPEPITAASAGIRGFTPRAKVKDDAAYAEQGQGQDQVRRSETQEAQYYHEEQDMEPLYPSSDEVRSTRDDGNPAAPSDSVESSDADLMELLAKLRSAESGLNDGDDADEAYDAEEDMDSLLREGRAKAQTMELFDEYSPAHPEDYLGQVVVAWEESIDRIPVDRIVKLRISLVMGRDGGTFPLLRLPFRLFAGGRIGSGMQGFPWIHIDDMAALILFCLDNPEIEGPVNAVAPDPVNNDEFGRTLSHIAKRPYWFHVPAFLVEKALGEQSALLLTGQHAYPRKALEHGFVFAYPRLEDALRNLLNR